MKSQPTEIQKQKSIKSLKKIVKGEMATAGINSTTRKGNKELELLIRKIVKQPIANPAQVREIGRKIATAILEISKQRGKNDLDRGIIRQIAFDHNISWIDEVSPLDEKPQLLDATTAKITTPRLQNSAEVTEKPVTKLEEVEEESEISQPAIAVAEVEETRENSLTSSTEESDDTTAAKITTPRLQNSAEVTEKPVTKLEEVEEESEISQPAIAVAEVEETREDSLTSSTEESDDTTAAKITTEELEIEPSSTVNQPQPLIKTN